jgi:hypothetical protein
MRRAILSFLGVLLLHVLAIQSLSNLSIICVVASPSHPGAAHGF